MAEVKAHQVSTNSFNENHAIYDQVRPNFIPEAVDSLTTNLGLHEGSKVMELASGTGKFTKAIRDNGYDLVTVEPSVGMIESFRKNFPEIPCVQGDSYKLPFDDNTFDALIIAQAFHWFADDASMKELARVLKSGGKLGMIWNQEDLSDLPEDHWQVQVSNYILSFDGDVPQYRHMKWPLAIKGQSYVNPDYQEAYFKWQKKNNIEDIWPYWESRSYITALPKEKKIEVKAKVEELLKKYVKPQDIDQNNQITSNRYVHVVWTVKP
jgi:ubiquinone/menaquinone biosynthesis C-methylase UbiE